MTRYFAPLLIAAMYFMTLPAPAHGLPSRASTFILSFLALALVAPTLTDFFAIKRWLFKDRARLAAILTNLTAAAVAIPLFLALQWLSSAAAMVLVSGPVRAAY
jgi:putative flippase GtrA